MKQKLTATIDEDLMIALKEHYRTNISEFVNEAIRKELEKNKDYQKVYFSLLEEYDNVTKRTSNLFEELEQLKIEGNKKEREIAQKILEDKQIKEEAKKNYLLEKYNLIKDSPLWLDFLQSSKDAKENIHELTSWAIRFQNAGHKVGAVQLRDFFSFNIIEIPQEIQQ